MPVGELTTDKSTVIHAKVQAPHLLWRRGQVRQGPGRAAEIAEGDLKKPKDFKLIGRKDIKRVDVPSKVDGTAKYGIDVQVPGMVYASLHAPMDGVKVESVNADDVKKIKGVTHVLSLPFGVAVVADTVEASRAGRYALNVKWDTKEAKAAPFDSEKAKEEYARKAKDPNAEAMEAFKTGDADKALAGAAKRLESVYWSEHTYHAQMEPMNAVARFPTTAPQRKSGSAPRCSRLPLRWWRARSEDHAGQDQDQPATARRRLRPAHLAGRSGAGGGDRQHRQEAGEAYAHREDDIAAARPRPMTHHVMKAGLDDKKNLVSWHHRIVAENVDAVAAPPRFAATKGRDYIGWVGMSQDFYNIPNLKADAIREQRGMRVHAWRGIGAGYNKFVSESFLDEVAAERGVDPLDYRLELTKTTRARRRSSRRWRRCRTTRRSVRAAASASPSPTITTR